MSRQRKASLVRQIQVLSVDFIAVPARYAMHFYIDQFCSILSILDSMISKTHIVVKIFNIPHHLFR